MKKEYGFTLIELIATITILGIIMLVAVPNVIGVVNKNKNQQYVNDARKLVTLAKYKFDSDANVLRPTDTRCIGFTLKYLDSSELKKGPEGGKYDQCASYVKIKYNSTENKYDYYVQLVEKYQRGGKNLKKGVSLEKNDNLVKINAKNTVIESDNDKFYAIDNSRGICNGGTYYGYNGADSCD